VQQVLQLNADYQPLRIIHWQRAVELILGEKVVLVAPLPNRFVRSASLALPWPAVVALRRYSTVRGRARFSSRTVQARDAYTCAYCGLRPLLPNGRPDRNQLTMDHVIPRAQAREGVVHLPWSRRWVNVTCWENVATACRACNARKAARTPQQARMPLRIYPRSPTQNDVLRMTFSRVATLPEVWLPWLPPGVVDPESVSTMGAGSLPDDLSFRRA
jgi:5-methylcytosine-specific restriction endonuclease McrA